MKCPVSMPWLKHCLLPLFDLGILLEINCIHSVIKHNTIFLIFLLTDGVDMPCVSPISFAEHRYKPI